VKSLLRRVRRLYHERVHSPRLRHSYERLIAEHTQRISYSLPTFLVSFPRSGSNFVQSILEGSSGLRCRSIYAGHHDSPLCVLSFKSHATSYEYLLDEIERLLSSVSEPSKLILLHRDPRDVMISFYEYAQMQKNAQIEQSEFVNNYDYFLAAPIDRECLRKVDYSPLNVSQAYQKHVMNWFSGPLPAIDYIAVRYEDLVHEPQGEFQRIFDFLELRCPLAEHLLGVKVSLYSSSRRSRGQACGWKNVDTSRYYDELLREVNHVLQDEIIALGYQP